MKNLILIAAVLGLINCGTPAHAQVAVNFNISQQPVWGPVGYDFVDYYYLPDIKAYYHVPTHQFTYWEDNKWATTNELPARYANFDLFKAHKVVLNQSNEPWLHDEEYKGKYADYVGRHDQVAIRDSHEEKYWENPNHPEHSKWHKKQ